MHTESERLLYLCIFILFFFNCLTAENLKILILMDSILRENISQKIHYIPSASISALDTTEYISTL